VVSLEKANRAFLVLEVGLYCIGIVGALHGVTFALVDFGNLVAVVRVGRIVSASYRQRVFGWHSGGNVWFLALIVKCWILPFHEVYDCGHSLVNLVLYLPQCDFSLVMMNFLMLDELAHDILSNLIYDDGNDSSPFIFSCNDDTKVHRHAGCFCTRWFASLYFCFFFLLFFSC